MPQQQDAILKGVHNDFDFLYEDIETRETLLADCHRALIDKAIICDVKKLFHDENVKYSSLFKHVYYGIRKVK